MYTQVNRYVVLHGEGKHIGECLEIYVCNTGD